MFEQAPTYTEKLERGDTFKARLFVRNDAACSRKITLPLSFTPPKSTNTRTIELAAWVPPRGILVDLELEPKELAEASIIPGRYAITFEVRDEEGNVAGRTLAGNPFRLGRDDVAIRTEPTLPSKLALADELTVSLAVENVGDTGNQVTPLIVFTRPGDTKGLEHYDPAKLVPPGISSIDVHLSRAAREKLGVIAGSWLVTVSMFDSAGDRLNSFAGLPITIGNIDIKMSRPELPVRVKSNEVLKTKFRFENTGDTEDSISAVIVFTKPGTTVGHELTFTRKVPPGGITFDAEISPTERTQRGVDKGVWLVSTSAFKSAGDRIKSFTGHYLEILD